MNLRLMSEEVYHRSTLVSLDLGLIQQLRSHLFIDFGPFAYLLPRACRLFIAFNLAYVSPTYRL